jgi:hypothetical protein
VHLACVAEKQGQEVHTSALQSNVSLYFLMRFSTSLPTVITTTSHATSLNMLHFFSTSLRTIINPMYCRGVKLGTKLVGDRFGYWVQNFTVHVAIAENQSSRLG